MGGWDGWLSPVTSLLRAPYGAKNKTYENNNSCNQNGVMFGTGAVSQPNNICHPQTHDVPMEESPTRFQRGVHPGDEGRVVRGSFNFYEQLVLL